MSQFKPREFTIVSVLPSKQQMPAEGLDEMSHPTANTRTQTHVPHPSSVPFCDPKPTWEWIGGPSLLSSY